MSHSSVDEKTVKVIKFPCTTIGSCLENDEDYDPCAKSQDITEDDFEIISKVQAATRKAEVQSKGKHKQDKEGDKAESKVKEEQDMESVIAESKGKQEEDKVDGGKGKRKKDSKQEGEVNADSNMKAVPGDGASVSTFKPIRKVCPKKVETNPFHRDRLALPSCKSPPPRFPPPQLYPPANEEVECPKRKKSKPCRKKTDIEENKTKSEDKSKSELKAETKDSTGRDGAHKEVGRSINLNSEQFNLKAYEYNPEKNVFDPDTNVNDLSASENDPDTNGDDLSGNENDRDTNGETSDTTKGKPRERSAKDEKPKKSSEFHSKDRKPCLRRRERKPCKKKVSEISISLLPPSIPSRQRDLPSISPKNISEVKRQTLMAKESMRVGNRKHCKGQPVNKTKNK